MVKARRWYRDTVAEMCGNDVVVYVMGFATVNDEQWCRVTERLGDVATMLCHPSRLTPIRPYVEPTCPI